ncbi:MAG TPA: TetR/AcrR family transcriptional regulator [Jatrophihabitantaceae bacterium]|jgi:AcrR family transcriptional regulator
MSSADTKQRLEAAALATLRTEGIAGLSARTVARRAGVNQALIFYHYESVPKLVEAAALASVSAAVARYQEDLAAAGTFAQLFAVGQQINAAERAAGNVAVMAQVVAGAHLDPAIHDCARACLDRWIHALEPSVERVLRGSPLRGLIEHRGLARAISSAFIGLELYETVDPDGAAGAVTSLEQLGAVLEAIDRLGPVAHRAVRAHVRRRLRRR